MAWMMRIWIGAERPETGARIRYADHGYRTGFVLAVERCGLRHIESACLRIFGIVEPKANVERVRRRQISTRIKPEDLIQKNGLDLRRSPSVPIGLEIGLIPGHTELPIECW